MSNESDLLNVVRDIASVFSQRRDMTSSSCSQHGCVLKTMLSHYNVFYRVSLCVTKISWLAFVEDDCIDVKLHQLYGPAYCSLHACQKGEPACCGVQECLRLSAQRS